MSYQPKPIETSGITLSADLVELTEHLAEKAHDLWAAQRMKGGWTWGRGEETPMPCALRRVDRLRKRI